MSFCSLGLGPEILKAIADVGYTTPTQIQAQAIPVVFMGRDVLGIAQTGTGKTASFTLPMIEILAHGRARARLPRSLILTPTRELAAQVSKNFTRYSCYHRLSMARLVGGESVTDQIRLLDRGVDVLIATPGRLLDLFQRGRVLLSDVRILVIDEADRMLDMGFIPDVERIVTLLPRRRQTLFFSATMPSEVKRLADVFLNEPREIHAAPPSQPADGIVQSLIIVDSKLKDATLRYFLRKEEVRSAFIFCNRKRDIGVLHRSLLKHGFPAGMLHGDLLQSIRTDTLEQFKAGEISLLVCSDVAARGIDITALSHVFNFDVPVHAEDYIHRIGRTGRAGMSGHALTLAGPEDSTYVGAIENLIGHQITRVMVDDSDAVEIVRERRKRGHIKKDHCTQNQKDSGDDCGAQGLALDDRTGIPTMEHPEDVLGFGNHVPAFFLVNALEHLANASESAHQTGRKAASLTRNTVQHTVEDTPAEDSASRSLTSVDVEGITTSEAMQPAVFAQGVLPSETTVSQKRRGRPRKRKGIDASDSGTTSHKRVRAVSRKTSQEQPG